MNRITGKVVLENSRGGVADLVVLAVDVDPVKLPEMDFGYFISSENLVGLLDLPHESGATEEVESWSPTRLGSVVTDHNGVFEIEFSDALFKTKDDGSDRRPDIVLYVMVPDRPAGETPIGRSIKDRIVYHTRPVRFEAGRMESFVIFLNEEQLSQFGLSVLPPPAGPTVLSPKHIGEMIAGEQNRILELGDVRRDLMGERSRRLDEEREVAFNLMERLSLESGLPREWFLSPGTKLFENPEILLPGITGMLESVFDDESLSTLVHLTDEDIESLGGSADRIRSGEEFGNLTLCGVLSQTGSPDSLLRSRSLLSEFKARRAVGRLSIGSVPEKVQRAFPWVSQAMWVNIEDEGRDTLVARAEETLARTEDGDFSEEGREDVKNAILDRLAAQVSQLPKLTGVETGGAVNELNRIKELVNKLELSGGPANVVATRDVNVLQLAFRWIWTSLFDQDFEGQVRRLYDNVVKLKEERGISPSDPGFDDIASSDDLRRVLQDIRRAVSVASDEPVPPIVSQRFPFVTRDRWARLDEEGRSALVELASRHRVVVSSGGEVRQNEQSESSGESGEPPRRRAERIDSSLPEVRARRVGGPESQAREILEEHTSNPIASADELVSDLEKRLTEPYSFDVFAPGHVNYGVMLTYRQEWSPVTYQVGELVETLPLAPGEIREFRVKNTTKERASRKTVDTSLRESLRQSESTRRNETEVLNKTSQAINNTINTKGSFNIGIGQVGTTTQFSQNFTEESRRLQKTFRELTRKASDKVRREHEVTIETETDFTSEETEKHTISNPNNEITVTYLLYELERRYQVASRLQQVQPVICVALDMPAPHEITEGWLIEHSWVLGESLLDPDLEPLLDYLEEDRAGDLMELELRRIALEEQKQRTSKLEEEYSGLAEKAKQRRQAIIDYMESLGIVKARKKASGGGKFGKAFRAIATGGLSEAIPGPDDAAEMNADILEAKQGAAEQALEYLQEQLETKGRALSQAQEALAEATEKYSEIVKGYAARQAAITRLQVHVRNNIYHYMHQIWSYQHPDKRFFSLYDREVPFFPPKVDDETPYTLRTATEEELDSEVPGARITGTPYVLEFDPPRPPESYDDIPKRKLGEIADIDRPLGFRGNYVIFPLRECCHLTDAMIYPYVDTYTGVRDPAYDRGYTGEELLEYAKEVWPELEEPQRTSLGSMIIDALVEYPNATQEVTLPTGQLFMEAIKGEATLLEDFKLAHRGLDVLKVEEEVRAERLDALRRASRVVEGELDIDPRDVEKYVVVRNGHADIDVDT